MTTPHIALLFNPNSGRGRAAASAQQLAAHLSTLGCSSFSLQIGINAPLTAEALRPASAAVVIGGDGTIHRTLAPALHAKIPIYHFPNGTENLFARHFRMRSDPAIAAQHIAARSIQPMDLLSASAPTTPPTLAAIMVSIGPDASVIHRLAAHRTGPITHLSYLRPIWAEVLRPSLSRLTVTVDDHPFITNRRGMLVIANLPTYARHINPAPHANPHDGLVNVVFLPSSFSLHSGLWLLACRFGLQGRLGAPITTGKAVRIHADRPFPWQADGEPTGHTNTLHVALHPQSLGVVVPPALRGI